MLVIGDSHVRRIREYQHLITAKLRQGRVSIDWRFRGGAYLDFAEREVERAYGYDIIVMMVGGNDLDRGTPRASIEASYARMENLARIRGVKRLIVTSIWPRRDANFNAVARTHARVCSSLYQNLRRNLITFWEWDERQPFRTYDGVHLEHHGYEKAVKYLLAPILWVIKHHM